MASGTDGNIISYDASGNPVAVATGTDGQVLTSTGAGSPPAFEALPSGGITHADIWRMTTSFNATTISPIVNWASNALPYVGHLGTQMSYSGGVFTFPTTGYWHVSLTMNVYKAGDCRQQEINIQTTSDLSNWYTVGVGDCNMNQGGEGSNVHASTTCEAIVDVTSSAIRVRFAAFGTQQVTWYGGSGRSNAVFTRLGDT